MHLFVGYVERSVMMRTLYSARVRPHLDCCVHVFSTRAVEWLEREQWRATKKTEGLSYEEGLRELGMLSSEEKAWGRLWGGGGGVINVHKYLKGGCKEHGAKLFSVVLSARTRDSGHPLKHRRHCLNSRKHILLSGQLSTAAHYPGRLWGLSLLEILHLDMVLGNWL